MSNLECGVKEPVVICTSGEGRVGVCQGDSGSGLTVKICSEDIWVSTIDINADNVHLLRHINLDLT